jgi:hypothetical protein
VPQGFADRAAAVLFAGRRFRALPSEVYRRAYTQLLAEYLDFDTDSDTGFDDHDSSV